MPTSDADKLTVAVSSVTNLIEEQVLAGNGLQNWVISAMGAVALQRIATTLLANDPSVPIKKGKAYLASAISAARSAYLDYYTPKEVANILKELLQNLHKYSGSLEPGKTPTQAPWSQGKSKDTSVDGIGKHCALIRESILDTQILALVLVT